jgi:hypothetical protein
MLRTEREGMHMDYIDEVRGLIRSGLNPGEPQTSGSLTLVPLFGGLLSKEYVLAAEALGEGNLEITELDGGNVPQLAAINKGSLPALLLDGEHLEGAMQNRIVNTSILLAPNAKTVLPVTCVEVGRWGYQDVSHFNVNGDVAYSRLRAKNASSVARDARTRGTRFADQGEVWDDVEAKHGDLHITESATGAMSDAYNIHRNELEAVGSHFAEPAPGQTGVIACVGGKVVALDSFDRPETLSKVWQGLVSGYAMESLRQPHFEMTADAIASFLTSAAEGEMTLHPGVGLGHEVIVTTTDVVGHALAWEPGVIHLALFPSLQPEPHDVHPDMSTPSRRRQFWS